LNIEALVRAATKGDGNAIQLINNSMLYADGDGAPQIIGVRKGDGKVRRNTSSGGTVQASPDKMYILTKGTDGLTVWNPADEDGIQSFTNGPFGVAVNKYSQMDEATGKPIKAYGFGTDKQKIAGSKESASSSSSTSNTTTQSAKTNTPVQQTTKMSVTEWNKKWSSLKKGEKLVGLDGKTYIKK